MKRIALPLFLAVIVGIAAAFGMDNASALAGSSIDPGKTTAASLTLSGDVTGAGNATVVNGRHLDQPTITPQTITAAGETVPIATAFASLNNTTGGSVTLGAPNISVTTPVAPVDGQTLTIRNDSAALADKIVFTNDQNLGGGLLNSKFMYANGATFELSYGQMMTVRYASAFGVWMFESASDINAMMADGVSISISTLAITGVGTKTTCTLNGSSPATCTASMSSGCLPFCAYGTAPNVAEALYCTISGTTVTAHDTALQTATVNILCL